MAVREDDVRTSKGVAAVGGGDGVAGLLRARLRRSLVAVADEDAVDADMSSCGGNVAVDGQSVAIIIVVIATHEIVEV